MTCDWLSFAAHQVAGMKEEGKKEGTYVYSRADMKAWASPPVMGMSAMRRVVTGRRVPASGISRNWSVHVEGLRLVVMEGVSWVVGRVWCWRMGGELDVGCGFRRMEVCYCKGARLGDTWVRRAW